MNRKIVVITGAYSGLGSALSKLLAKKGYKLILTGRDKTKLEKFRKEISKQTVAVSAVADIRKKKDCNKIINTAAKKFGKIDAV